MKKLKLVLCQIMCVVTIGTAITALYNGIFQAFGIAIILCLAFFTKLYDYDEIDIK